MFVDSPIAAPRSRPPRCWACARLRRRSSMAPLKLREPLHQSRRVLDLRRCSSRAPLKPLRVARPDRSRPSPSMFVEGPIEAPTRSPTIAAALRVSVDVRRCSSMAPLDARRRDLEAIVDELAEAPAGGDDELDALGPRRRGALRW